MGTYRITERELRDISRSLSQRWKYDKDVKWEYNARGYIMVSYGNRLQHHFRFDLVDFDGPTARKQKLIDGSYNYLLTSMHVKGEESYDNKQYAYLYLNYVSGGVWQPIWGYLKEEGGRRVRKLELTARELASAYTDAHALMEALSKATPDSHAIAMGPVLGAGSTAREVGLQGIEW